MPTNMALKSFLFILLLSTAVGPVCLGQTGTYRFEDEKGNIYLVDSMKKVPERYRLSVDRIPGGPDLAVLGNALQAPMASGDAAAIRKLLFSYVYKDPLIIGFGIASVLIALIILFSKSRLNRVSLYLLLVAAILIFHTVVVVPHIQKKTFIFGNAAISMTPALQRSEILPYRMLLNAYATRPASIKPWDIHWKLRGLASETVRLAQR